VIFLFSYVNDLDALARTPREKLVEDHVGFYYDVLQQRSRVVTSCELGAPDQARSVFPEGGDMVVRDGPAQAADWVLGGFHLLECADMDEALAIARAYPMPEGLGGIEVRPVRVTWEEAPSIDSPASPATIWRLYRDPDTWPEWKSAVEDAHLDGDFGAGATGELQPPGRQPMTFRVVEADENARYVSDTRLSETAVLRMEHRLTPLEGGGTRITHSATIPSGALAEFGMEFRLAFNDGIRETLRALSERAVEDERGAA